MLYALCGLPGSRKTTVIEAVLRQAPQLVRVVTVTTGQPRSDEIPGRMTLFSQKERSRAWYAAGYSRLRGYGYATAVEDLHACVHLDALAVFRPHTLTCIEHT